MYVVVGGVGVCGWREGFGEVMWGGGSLKRMHPTWGMLSGDR